MATQSITQSLLNTPRIWTVIKELSPPGSAMQEIFSALAQSGMSPSNMFDGLKNTQTFARDAADRARKTAGNLGSFMSKMKQRTNPADTGSMIDRGITPDEDFGAFPEDTVDTAQTPSGKNESQSLPTNSSQPSTTNRNKTAPVPEQAPEKPYKPFANPGEPVFPEGTSPEETPQADISFTPPDADNQAQPIQAGKPTNLPEEESNQAKNGRSFYNPPIARAQMNNPAQKARKQILNKSKQLARPLENDLKTTNKKLKPLEQKIRQLKAKKAAVQASMLLILIGAGILFLLSGLFFILIVTFKLGLLFGGWAISLVTSTYPKLTQEITKIQAELRKLQIPYNQLKKHQKDVENNITQIYQSAQIRARQLETSVQQPNIQG